MKAIPVLLLASGSWLLQAGAARAQSEAPLPVASPASQGVSAPGLNRVHELLQEATDAGEYLGAVTLVARNGRIVDWRAFGHRDLARTAPMDRNAIFRIYSMTKTVTSVAALMLMEQGKLALEEPIARFLPEFADMQVFVSGTAETPQARAALRPITILHLLTHTAGFAVGGEDPAEAVKKLERAALHESPDLKTYCERLSRLPLAADPGTRFNYDGVQIVVLSRLIEVVSGMAFDQFLQQRIFTPLRLEDTGFIVPEQERARIAEMTSTDREGRLVSAPEYVGTHAGDRINRYDSGAGGLYSTAADYARFSQMLLNGGELDGASILSRKTVQLMMSNQLTHLPARMHEFRAGEGFGLGGYVVLDAERRGRAGSVGQFGWFGAASTYYAIDREEQLIAILMLQHLPQGLPRDPPKLGVRFYNQVYQSLLR